MSARTPATREKQREETRRRVFAAALEVFRRDGVTGCRIEDIAAAAGVSRGTFYFHFPSKEDVVAELLRQSEERVAAALDRLPAATALAAALATVGAAITSEWQADPALFPEVGVVALKRTAAGLGDAHLHPVRGALATHFRAAAGRGELASDLPPELLSDFFLANTFTAALAWCANPVLPLGEVLRRAAELFLEGAAGRGPHAAASG